MIKYQHFSYQDVHFCFREDEAFLEKIFGPEKKRKEQTPPQPKSKIDQFADVFEQFEKGEHYEQLIL